MAGQGQGRQGEMEEIEKMGRKENSKFKIQNSRAAVGAKHLAISRQLFLLISLQML